MPGGRKPNLARRRQIAALRAQGLSLQQIGQRLGISKQAVFGSLNYARRQTRVQVLTCSGCGADIVSAAALPSDGQNVLCLRCVGVRPSVTFGQRLRALRLAAGLSKTDLARKAGLAAETIRNYERDRHPPTASRLARLVRILGKGLTHDGRPPRGRGSSPPRHPR